MLMVNDLELALPNASVAVTVTLASTGVVGVPELTPVEALMARPAGSVPVVIDGSGTTVMLSVFDAVFPLASMILTVKLEGAVDVGVPENTPADDIEIPEGKLPDVSDQVYGPMPPLGASVAA